MPARNPTITLEMASDDDRAVNFREFHEFCGTVSECLSRSEAIVTGSKGHVRYRLADLHMGSAVLTLEAERTEKARGRDRRAQVVGLFKRTVTAIQTGKRVDKRLGIDDLHTFKKLANPLKRRNVVKIDSTEITPDFVRNADRLLHDTIPTEGFVAGRLEKLSVHERNEFVIFPPIPGYSIVCRFNDSLLDKVREAIKRTVTVYGTMHYAPDSPFPRLVIVRTMDIHPHDEQLPTLCELRGIGKGCTGELTAVEYVQTLRDE